MNHLIDNTTIDGGVVWCVSTGGELLVLVYLVIIGTCHPGLSAPHTQHVHISVKRPDTHHTVCLHQQSQTRSNKKIFIGNRLIGDDLEAEMEYTLKNGIASL